MGAVSTFCCLELYPVAFSASGKEESSLCSLTHTATGSRLHTPALSGPREMTAVRELGSAAGQADMAVPRDSGSVSSLNVAPGNAGGSSVHADICRPTFRPPVGEARKLLVRWTEKTTLKRRLLDFSGLEFPRKSSKRLRSPNLGQQRFAEEGDVPWKPHSQAERSEGGRL